MIYWQHGHSTERDFIYVTTAHLSHEQLQQLSDEVGPERSLLVLCTAFRGRGDYPNLTVKKIPKQVLSRCEWGHDDYSLQVENLPKAPPHPGPLPSGDGFVKEPAVVTRKNFNPAGMSPEEVERLKLEDGVRLHESVKVELESLISFSTPTKFCAWQRGFGVTASLMSATISPNNNPLGTRPGNRRRKYPSSMGRIAFATALWSPPLPAA
ncbi:MAG: hypothetical protein A2W68_13735 [Betaproteobacteria bacterium RIFCSPLOWO2_02_64_14]|nr:MAG: hypothetical protein A2W68_13735 [Betaproteobacteria bacterium RIFCSPLOWO2_02_64_14]